MNLEQLTERLEILRREHRQILMHMTELNAQIDEIVSQQKEILKTSEVLIKFKP